MRHQKKHKRLSKIRGRDRSILQNQAVSLILYEKIKTTDTRAKNLRRIVEKLITIAKSGDLSARRKLLSYLPKEGAVRKLMEELGPRYKDRKGGYTRLRKIGWRSGDGAPISQIELV